MASQHQDPRGRTTAIQLAAFDDPKQTWYVCAGQTKPTEFYDQQVAQAKAQELQAPPRVFDNGAEYVRGLGADVCVVCIAGVMRGGKSYIMNLLVDRDTPEQQRTVFDLGETVESKTRGVWAFATRDRKTGKLVLLLDFEVRSVRHGGFACFLAVLHDFYLVLKNTSSVLVSS